ncbi:hypothetical protein KUCAC02_016317 [Chaenocephalus aceratus]|uniref:Uncharacterized protein n=1 Tax=Chaenocephalus aceratus TaxID=36190 RepID=A0ACB9Y1I6_CHAAC|nr:hypothetical protein KUCAC02_016317 [Chaenocephalus aceratus]
MGVPFCPFVFISVNRTSPPFFFFFYYYFLLGKLSLLRSGE